MSEPTELPRIVRWGKKKKDDFGYWHPIGENGRPFTSSCDGSHTPTETNWEFIDGIKQVPGFPKLCMRCLKARKYPLLQNAERAESVPVLTHARTDSWRGRRPTLQQVERLASYGWNRVDAQHLSRGAAADIIDGRKTEAAK